MFQEYDTVTLTMRYLQVLHGMVVWFHKIRKIFFQIQPSCPKHMYPGH